MRLRGIDTDAENDRSGILVLSEIAFEILSLQGAAARKILRVEIKHDPFSPVILEADVRPVTAGETEIRRGGSDGGLFCCFGTRQHLKTQKAGDYGQEGKDFVHFKP